MHIIIIFHTHTSNCQELQVKLDKVDICYYNYIKELLALEITHKRGLFAVVLYTLYQMCNIKYIYNIRSVSACSYKGVSLSQCRWPHLSDYCMTAHVICSIHVPVSGMIRHHADNNNTNNNNKHVTGSCLLINLFVTHTSLSTSWCFGNQFFVSVCILYSLVLAKRCS